MSNLTDFIGHNIARSATEPADKTKFWFNETDFKLYYYDYTNLAWIETTKQYTINTFDIFSDNSAVALYQLDGNALDTGGAYNGTWSGTAAYVTGKFGQAASMPAAGDFITLPNNILTTDFSITCWINISSFFNYNTIFTTDNSNTSGFFDIVADSNSKLSINWYDGSNRPQLLLSDVLSVNTWYFVSVTKSGSNYSLSINAGTPVTTTNSLTLSQTNVQIGSNPATTSERIKGLIDQIRIFNRALTATEVNTLYTEV